MKLSVSHPSHSPWKSRKERGITTFPPHGDYYWIWTFLLCSSGVISTLQQQRGLAAEMAPFSPAS